jgi:DNA-binding winged helix-turn-helix (wHTH) protein
VQANNKPRWFRFAVFEADIRTGELTKNGRRIRLQELPFRLLAALLEKSGEVVTREELRERLWPKTTVDFDHGLNKAVSKIREALGDSAENPRFVETVARRGYRFLAEVTPVCEVQQKSAAADPATSLASTGSPPPVGPSFKNARRLFALGLALVLVTSLWIAKPWRHSSPTIGSLAVLPLENLSNTIPGLFRGRHDRRTDH